MKYLRIIYLLPLKLGYTKACNFVCIKECSSRFIDRRRRNSGKNLPFSPITSKNEQGKARWCYSTQKCCEDDPRSGLIEISQIKRIITKGCKLKFKLSLWKILLIGFSSKINCYFSNLYQNNLGGQEMQIGKLVQISVLNENIGHIWAKYYFMNFLHCSRDLFIIQMQSNPKQQYELRK